VIFCQQWGCSGMFYLVTSNLSALALEPNPSTHRSRGKPLSPVYQYAMFL
jgi:hypothetical protein